MRLINVLKGCTVSFALNIRVGTGTLKLCTSCATGEALVAAQRCIALAPVGTLAAGVCPELRRSVEEHLK